MPEDEFFDAVETGLEKIEEDMQLRFKLKLQSQISQSLVNVPHEAVAEGEEAREEFGTGAEAKSHALWPEVSRKLYIKLFPNWVFLKFSRRSIACAVSNCTMHVRVLARTAMDGKSLPTRVKSRCTSGRRKSTAWLWIP